MAQSCTIFCKKLAAEQIDSQIQRLFPSQIRQISKGSALVRSGRCKLQLTTKVFCESGDEFSRLRYTTIVFVESLTNVPAERRQQLTSRIESSELIVGVVAEPEFDADERFHDLVFAIAKSLDGVIFDGKEFLDGNGELLARSDGQV